MQIPGYLSQWQDVNLCEAKPRVTETLVSAHVNVHLLQVPGGGEHIHPLLAQGGETGGRGVHHLEHDAGAYLMMVSCSMVCTWTSQCHVAQYVYGQYGVMSCSMVCEWSELYEAVRVFAI
jgi:hypothetical protein